MSKNHEFECKQRKSREFPLWQILSEHFDDFEERYDEFFSKEYGLYRPISTHVVRGFLTPDKCTVPLQCCGQEREKQTIQSYFCSSQGKKVIEFLSLPFCCLQ
jgi:hypothetical protein